MIGCEAKYECPSCGNILTVRGPVFSTKGGFKFGCPNGCPCGRRGSFTLMKFKEIVLDFVPDGHEIVKKVEKKK